MSSSNALPSPQTQTNTVFGDIDDRELFSVHHERSHTIDIVEHRVATGFESIEKSLPWKNQAKKSHKSHSLQDLRHRETPYHKYIHSLAAAGWDHLQELDIFMTTAPPQKDLVFSVLDITNDLGQNRWPDLHTEFDLGNFMAGNNKDGVKVRLYLAEYKEFPTPALIETLGSSLNLDPRFFRGAIHRKGHVFTPSQRHRAPFVSLGFGILNNATIDCRTDAEKFKVLVYIQPDENGGGWTGVLLFSSQTKHKVSSRSLTAPPLFRSPLPSPITKEAKSLRELYLESFESVILSEIVDSPFYLISNLLRLNCFCWNQVITAIREEDHKINGISDTSIGHTEEIKQSLSVVQHSGSLGWKGRQGQITTESREELEEDFNHLMEQTEMLWQTRDKIAAIQRRNSDARWNSLTNAFTYLFAPITIISGIYGMNVSQISGSNTNPDIWQFFVAVVIMSFIVVVVFSASNWISIQSKHNRSAGLKEVISFAVGHHRDINKS